MSKQFQEMIVAKGGIQIPAAAGSGKVAVSDASGNISWLALTDPAPAFTTYKPIRERGGQIASGATGARLLLPDTNSVVGSSSAGRGGFGIDPADYAVSGRTTKLRISGLVIVNAVAPGVDITLALQPISAVAGGAGAITVTLGAAVTGSSVTFTAPGSSSMNRSTSADFDIPTAGVYALTATMSGATATNCEIVARATLQLRQV